MSHAVIRTSPKGGPFIGQCSKCGQGGLRMSAALEDCPADTLVSDEKALLDILNADELEASEDATPRRN